MDETPPVVTGLPRRDTRMGAILLTMMILASIVVTALGLPARGRPALIIMPATFAFVWACYAGSIAVVLGRAKTDHRVVGRMATFMGRTLSLLGSVMAIAHLGLLAFVSGRIGEEGGQVVLRLFMVGLSVVLIITHNQMPKFVASCLGLGALVMTRGVRVAGWAGVLCGIAMAIVAVTQPLNRLTPIVMTLGFLPVVIVLGSTLIWWFERRRAGQP